MSFLLLAKNASNKRKLLRQVDFGKALYMFDIGKNDLTFGILEIKFDQIRPVIPTYLTN